jgi:hypothetical protein
VVQAFRGLSSVQAERHLRRLVKVASKEQQGERHGYGACR